MKVREGFREGGLPYRMDALAADAGMLRDTAIAPNDVNSMVK